MTTESQHNLISICSVTQMAKQLDLSRARFYQLQKKGAFPSPVYGIHTRRPFYPITLQVRCLTIRKTGMDLNGHPVLFYTKQQLTPKTSAPTRDSKYQELADLIKPLGLTISARKVKEAVKTLNLDLSKPVQEEGAVIKALFQYFVSNV